MGGLFSNFRIWFLDFGMIASGSEPCDSKSVPLAVRLNSELKRFADVARLLMKAHGPHTTLVCGDLAELVGVLLRFQYKAHRLEEEWRTTPYGINQRMPRPYANASTVSNFEVAKQSPRACAKAGLTSHL